MYGTGLTALLPVPEYPVAIDRFISCPGHTVAELDVEALLITEKSPRSQELILFVMLLTLNRPETLSKK